MRAWQHWRLKECSRHSHLCHHARASESPVWDGGAFQYSLLHTSVCSRLTNPGDSAEEGRVAEGGTQETTPAAVPAEAAAAPADVTAAGAADHRTVGRASE